MGNSSWRVDRHYQVNPIEGLSVTPSEMQVSSYFPTSLSTLSVGYFGICQSMKIMSQYSVCLHFSGLVSFCMFLILCMYFISYLLLMFLLDCWCLWWFMSFYIKSNNSSSYGLQIFNVCHLLFVFDFLVT